jgi:two-component system, LuxR family, response regulator FixJ
MVSPPVVHLVDDDASVRNSIPRLFDSASLDVRVYESGEEFLQCVDPLHIGCVVTDLKMPGMSGIDVLERLRAAQNEIPAIIISGHADVPAAIHCMKLGAVDVLQKPFESVTLLQAVQGALQKSVELYERRLEQNRIQALLAELTPREQELLRLIVIGRSNKQIAMDLHIAFRTVINHRAHLMAKTHAANAADLARMATIAGIVPTK